MDYIKEITDILECSTYDYVEQELRDDGYTCPDIEPNEDIEECSEEIRWDCSFEIIKDDKVFMISLNGSAIAEISYGRWTESYGYCIDDFSVNEG